MKFVIVFVAIIGLCLKMSAQEKKTYSLHRKIIDAETKKPLQNCTVNLLDEKMIPTRTTQTDNEGLFSFNKLVSQNVFLTIEYIGYGVVRRNIIIYSSNQQIDTIEILKKVKTLKEVVVVGKKKLIENKVDRLIYNVEQDITSQGSVATDVLKKVPQVTVDADGNVELLGNPSILFLVNGKPSSLFGNNPSEALQSIPTSQIERIEVMTTPPSKYQASSTGGIINIVLKKSKLEGYHGVLNLSAGSRLENGSLNGSFKQKNYSLNAFISGNEQLAGKMPNGSIRTSQNTNGSNVLVQDGRTDFGRNSYKMGMGIDWNITPKDILSATVSTNGFSKNNKGNIAQESYGYDFSHSLLNHFKSLRTLENNNKESSLETNITYHRDLGKNDRNIEFSFENSTDYIHNYYYQTQDSLLNPIPFAGSYSQNPGRESETNWAVDYTQPLGEDVSIETGFRYTNQEIISSANVFTLLANTNFFHQDNLQSYQSNYKRNIYAGYISASYSLWDWLDVKSGIRYEFTKSKAWYNNGGNVSIPDYGNLAPSLILSHKLKKGLAVKLAYSYRIERPDFGDLNPFMNLSDPNNIVTGNPNLKPEIGNNFQFGLNNTLENGGNINVVLFCNYNSPDIKPFTTYYPTYKIGDSTYTNVSITTKADISAETRTGINISGSIPIGHLTITPNAMFYNRHLVNPFDSIKVTNGLGCRGSMNVTYQLSNNWVTEAFGNYNYGMKWQGRTPKSYSYTFAAKKQLWKNKGSIGLIVVNLFDKYVRQNYITEAKNISTNGYRNQPCQSFGIVFSYKFGALKMNKQKEGENFLYTAPAE